jgi:citrate synthase
MNRLQELINSKLPAAKAQLRSLKALKLPLGPIQVKHVLNGLRGAKVLNWTCGTQDPMKGLLIRGLPIEEVVVRLPRRGTAPLPEGLLWFLLTGRMPKGQELEEFLVDIRQRAILPSHTAEIVEKLPAGLPLLSKLSIGLMTMQPDSHFARSYAAKAPRADLWNHCLEDSITIFSRLPSLLALVYKSQPLGEFTDYAQAIAHAIQGKSDGRLTDVIRLLIVVLAEGDGGSVSSHASKAVSSTLSDPYLALAAGFNALSGPRHAKASQDAMEFLWSLSDLLGHLPSDPAISAAFKEIQGAQGTIPGFGHAILQVPDKRFALIMDYMKTIAPSDPRLSLADRLQFLGTEALKASAMRNPAPNADLAVAAALGAVGLRDSELCLAIFALGRTLGILSNMVWDRALQIPIEYGVSVNLEELEQLK